MPHLSMYFSADELLDEIDQEDIKDYLIKRKDPNDRNSMIPIGEEKATLDEAVHQFRKMQRYDLAYKLDEIKFDYL